MITGIFYQGVQLFTTTTISQAATGVITLQGYNFNLLDGVILSATNYYNLTALNAYHYITGFTRQSPISGGAIPYIVQDENNLTIALPTIWGACTATFIPFNSAGYSTSPLIIFV